VESECTHKVKTDLLLMVQHLVRLKIMLMWI